MAYVYPDADGADLCATCAFPDTFADHVGRRIVHDGQCHVCGDVVVFGHWQKSDNLTAMARAIAEQQQGPGHGTR